MAFRPDDELALADMCDYLSGWEALADREGWRVALDRFLVAVRQDGDVRAAFEEFQESRARAYLHTYLPTLQHDADEAETRAELDEIIVGDQEIPQV